MKWGEQVNQDLKRVKFVQPEEVQSIVGSWHMVMRLAGRVINPPQGLYLFLLYMYVFNECWHIESGRPSIFQGMGFEMAKPCQTYSGLKLDPLPERIFWTRAWSPDKIQTGKLASKVTEPKLYIKFGNTIQESLAVDVQTDLSFHYLPRV